MYQLTAIFNKASLSDVIEGLYDKQIEGITVMDVLGKGGFAFIKETEKIDLDKKVRIDIILPNEKAKENAKEAIRSNTQDVGHGSGKMWVIPIFEVERIRTGELNKSALKQSHPNYKKNTSENYYTMLDTPAS